MQGEMEGGELSAAACGPSPMMKLEVAEERRGATSRNGRRSKQCLKSRHPSSFALPFMSDALSLSLSPLLAAPAATGTALRPHWSTHGRGWRRPTARGPANGRRRRRERDGPREGRRSEWGKLGSSKIVFASDGPRGDRRGIYALRRARGG